MGNPQLDRLLSVLNNSRILKPADSAFSVIQSLIKYLQGNITDNEALGITVSNIISGINQLTGDVTAGPGTGSQVATISNDAIITAKILNSAVTLAKIANASANSKLLGSGAAGSGSPYSELTLGTNLSFSGNTLNAALAATVKSITLGIDGGGSVITTGIKADVYIPYSGVITGVAMLADQSGSVVVDIWKDVYANYPPTVADSITAAAKPTISATVKSRDTTLTGWNTAVTAGDTMRFNVDSAASITRLNLTLTVAV